MTDSKEKKGYVKGSLKQVPLPKVLYFIHNADKTGVLAVAHEKKKIHMHFLKGNIVYVTSSYFSGLSLGDFLLKEGKISMQIHEESLDKIRGTNNKQGTYLVEKGYLSPHDLAETLNRQVIEKLFWLFEWEDGEFYFKESEIIDENLRLVDISIQRLVYQGVRDHTKLKSLPLEFKGRRENVLFRRSDVPFRLDTLGMSPIDTRILSFVNGQYTLRQIVALARLKKRAIYKILYGLFLANVICFTEGAAASARKELSKQKDALGKAPATKREGYEIKISNDVISEAMKSVDRIHEQVSIEKTTEETKIAAAASAKIPTGTGDVMLDELGAKLDERMATGEGAIEDETRFGFDDSSPDGFAAFEDDDSILGDDYDYESELGNIDSQDFAGKRDNSKEESFPFEDSEFVDEDQAHEQEPMDDEEFDSRFNVDVNDYTDPEEVRKQGLLLLEEERWDDAEAFLQRAIDMLPDDWELYAHLGWAMYNSSTFYDNKLEAAETTIKQGMGTGKSLYLHFLFLGKIYLENGHYEFAELHFIKALEMNVDCLEAREQIKQIHAK